MTSVAASMFGSLTTVSPPDGGATDAKVAGSFNAMLGLVQATPSGDVAAGGKLTQDPKLPTNVFASLVATLSGPPRLPPAGVLAGASAALPAPAALPATDATVPLTLAAPPAAPAAPTAPLTASVSPLTRVALPVVPAAPTAPLTAGVSPLTRVALPVAPAVPTAPLDPAVPTAPLTATASPIRTAPEGPLAVPPPGPGAGSDARTDLIDDTKAVDGATDTAPLALPPEVLVDQAKSSPSPALPSPTGSDVTATDTRADGGANRPNRDTADRDGTTDTLPPTVLVDPAGPSRAPQTPRPASGTPPPAPPTAVRAPAAGSVSAFPMTPTASDATPMDTDPAIDAERPNVDAPKADRPERDLPAAETTQTLPPPAPTPAVPLAVPLAALALVAPPPAAPAGSASPSDAEPVQVAAASAPSSGKGAHAPTGQLPVATDRRVAATADGGEKAPSGKGDDASSLPHRATAQTDKVADVANRRADDPSFALPVSPAPAVTPEQRAPQNPTGSITAQPGRIGQELGVAIARHVTNGAANGGGETITLKLNPVDMGRIEVKLSFDDGGTLRAVVSADNPAALDMLRRDSADLGRALADAGVRADPQTLRFDTRSGTGQGNGNGPAWQRQPDGRNTGMPDTGGTTAEDVTAAYRPLRTRGRVDMVA